MTKKIPRRNPFLWIWKKLSQFWHFITNTNWTWILWLVGAAIIIALGLYVYVSFRPDSNPFLYHLFGLDSIKEKGTIFSNTSAPIVALGAAVLLFLSFWAQYQANQRQWGWIKRQEKEKAFERIQSIISMINKDYRQRIESIFVPESKGSIPPCINNLKLKINDAKIDKYNIDKPAQIVNSSISRINIRLKLFDIIELVLDELEHAGLTELHKKILINQIVLIEKEFNMLKVFEELLGQLENLEDLRRQLETGETHLIDFKTADFLFHRTTQLKIKLLNVIDRYEYK